jgi:helix-turn-helix protein
MMIKVVLKVSESEINHILSELVKLGINNIKIKKKRKSFNLFRYKNTFKDNKLHD